MLAPTVLGAYCGFRVEKPVLHIKEDYATKAQRKVQDYGTIIANSPFPTCIPLSDLPYPVNEIKEAIQHMYLYSASDEEYRNSLFQGYLQLSDFVPDEQAKIVRTYYQHRTDRLAETHNSSEGEAALGKEAVRIAKEKQVQHDLLWDEWQRWLQQVGPKTLLPK